MEQTAISSPPPSSSSSSPPRKDINGEAPPLRRKLRSAQEIVSYYESQGVSTSEAPLKAIEDLQTALLRAVDSGGGKKDNKFMSRKLDNLNTRLAILEMKLDTKPGYVETAVIGLASGLSVKGICSVFPHIAGSLGQMWESMKSTTRT